MNVIKPGPWVSLVREFVVYTSVCPPWWVSITICINFSTEKCVPSSHCKGRWMRALWGREKREEHIISLSLLAWLCLIESLPLSFASSLPPSLPLVAELEVVFIPCITFLLLLTPVYSPTTKASLIKELDNYLNSSLGLDLTLQGLNKMWL